MSLGSRISEWKARGRHLLVALGVASSVVATGAVLSFYEESLPGTLNPLFASSMVDYRSQELVFDRLYFHSPIDNRIMSRVIEKGEVAEGGKGWKITLKQGLKWHDGKPVTAKDVCFTVNAMLDPGTPSPIAAGYRSVLAGCEVQGANVAVVKFTKVFHNPQERLGFALLPEAAFPNGTAISPIWVMQPRNSVPNFSRSHLRATAPAATVGAVSLADERPPPRGSRTPYFW